MSGFKDLTGKSFGLLTVISRAPTIKKCARWNCICTCGKTTVTTTNALKRGNTRSCGCLRAKNQKRTHNLSRHPLYRHYYGMKQRCENKNNDGYKDYGGRGIKVCDEWENNFLAFYEWAIKNGYRKGLSLDRIDNNSGYSPENCRWATPIQQGNNRRTCKPITYNGETHTIPEWSRIVGIKKETIRSRLLRGWPMDEVFGAPHVRKTGYSLPFGKKTAVYKDGELIGVFESETKAAESVGITVQMVSNRIGGRVKNTTGYTFKRYEEVEYE